MSTPGPSTQLLLDLDYSSDAAPPSPAHISAPIPASLTPAFFTPAATTTPVPENTLAAMAAQPPAKPTAAFSRLIKMTRVREVLLRERKILSWGRATNQEDILGQTRGEYPRDPCKKCEEGDGPFAVCIVISGEFSGSCANCHYNSLGVTCSFRPCKYFSPFAIHCNSEN